MEELTGSSIGEHGTLCAAPSAHGSSVAPGNSTPYMYYLSLPGYQDMNSTADADTSASHVVTVHLRDKSCQQQLVTQQIDQSGMAVGAV